MSNKFAVPINNAIVKERIERALKRKEEGRTIDEILVEQYVGGLEDKTPAQAELMIRTIRDTIAKFNREYSQAKVDCSAWVDSKLDEMTTGKTTSEQFALFMRMYVVITACDAQLAGESEQQETETLEARIKVIETSGVTEGSVSEADLAALRTKLKEAMMNSTSVAAGSVLMGELIESVGDDEQGVPDITQGLFTTVEYEMLLAMLCYIACKDGSIPDVSHECTIETVTLGVCAEVEQSRVMRDSAAQGGDFTQSMMDVFKIIACVVWTVGALLVIALPAAVFGASAGGLLGCIVAVGLCAWMIYQTDVIICKYFEPTIETISLIGLAVVRIAWGALKLVYRGLKKLIAAAVPVIKAAAQTAWEFVTDSVQRGVVWLQNVTSGLLSPKVQQKAKA